MKKCAQCGCGNPDNATQCSQCGGAEFVVSVLSPEQSECGKPVESSGSAFDVSPTGESALCVYCLCPNRPDAYWCERCGAPLGATATFGPLESALAVGFAYRAAVRGRPKFFVLLSVWVLCFPSLLANAVTLSIVISSGADLFVGTIELCLCIIGGAVSAAMLYQVTNNYLTIPKIVFDKN